MKVSLNWIKDYVKLPEDMDLTRLAYDLTMSTVEVEGAEDLAKRFEHMLVGVVTEVCPHPNADKLRICKTDIGGGDVREIVCGGTNLTAGMRVAVACPGALCRWHGEGEPVEIKESKLRGVKSYGMICAASEIGLGDLFPTDEEAHILDLSAFDVPAGTSIADALDLHDIILEIDNKSMTNRPDLWGHYGLAREIAALYGLPLSRFRPFPRDLPAGGLTVTVEDPERCPRYIGAELTGVCVKPSPFWMQSRLWRAGMRPINALVDITNYVMLATGQPTHAFDSDNIQGHIIVRRAQEGEKLLLLKPQTFMNDSGLSVMDAARFYKLPPERVLVLFDDISLPVGRLRIRADGSAGGHNGLKNIIAHLGTDQFPRVKVGVGNKPRPDSDMAAWVLGKFTGPDREAMEAAVKKAADAVTCLIEQGADKAMAQFNG